MKEGISQKDFLDQLEHIKKANQAKPRKNSKKKGDRGEREIAEVFNKRFGGGFKRVPQSGALVGGQNFQKNDTLRQDAIEILSSDIICPQQFLWSIESKAYSADSVKIHHFLVDKNHEVGEWWMQAKEDAAKSRKHPMLIVRLDRSPRFAIIQQSVFERWEHLFEDYLSWKRANNDRLVIVELDQLLSKLGADFFGI